MDDNVVTLRLFEFYPAVKPEFAHLPMAELCELEESGVEVLDPQTFNFSDLDELLAETASDTLAFDAILRLSSMVIRGRANFPAVLSEWIADYLGGNIKRPRARGLHPKSNLMRDLSIRAEIRRIVQVGEVSATRNVATSGKDCACDLVANRRGMTYGAVAKIWQRRSSD